MSGVHAEAKFGGDSRAMCVLAQHLPIVACGKRRGERFCIQLDTITACLICAANSRFKRVNKQRNARVCFLQRFDDRNQAIAVARAQDPELLSFAIAGGKSAFADNCAPCHGLGAAGRPGGYPSLADDDWIWGGSLEAIETTIRYGIRNDSDEARVSDMPAFGADEILSNAEIADLTEYVLSFSGRAEDQEAVGRAGELYADNCAACHGEAGEGIADVGGPKLNDQLWLYGDSREAIMTQIGQPRQGVMPGWQERLDESTIKMLTIYVHTLGGGQ